MLTYESIPAEYCSDSECFSLRIGLDESARDANDYGMAANILTSRFVCTVFATACMICQQVFACCACCSQPASVESAGQTCCAGCSTALEKSSGCSSQTLNSTCCGEESSDGEPCSGTCCQGAQLALVSQAMTTAKWFAQAPAVFSVAKLTPVAVAPVGFHDGHPPGLSTRLAVLCVWRN